MGSCWTIFVGTARENCWLGLWIIWSISGVLGVRNHSYYLFKESYRIIASAKMFRVEIHYIIYIITISLQL